MLRKCIGVVLVLGAVVPVAATSATAAPRQCGVYIQGAFRIELTLLPGASVRPSCASARHAVIAPQERRRPPRGWSCPRQSASAFPVIERCVRRSAGRPVAVAKLIQQAE